MEKIEKRIFYLYIFLLPITNIKVSTRYIFSLGLSASFYVSIIGIIFMILRFIKNKKIIKDKNIIIVIAILLLLNTMSIIMSLFTNYELGTLFGRNTCTAILPHIIYVLQIIITITYNVYMLRKVDIMLIFKIMLTSIICVLIYGWIQIVLININIPFISNIYNSVMGFFEDMGASNLSYIGSRGRVNLMNYEASSAGVFVSVYALPLIWSMYNNKLISKKNFIFIFIMFIPIVIYMDSSAAYYGLVLFLTIIILSKINAKLGKTALFIFIIVAMILIPSILNMNTVKNSYIYEKTIEKTVENRTENLSSIHRNSSIYTNFKAFIEHPILGVGNGNQGFYYIKYFPNWAFKSYESKGYYYGNSGWPGSGAIIPTIISGYGIVGIFLIGIIICISYKNLLKLKNTNLEFIYQYIMISFMLAIPQGISTLMIIGEYYIVFLISMSIFNYKNKINKIEEYKHEVRTL